FPQWRMFISANSNDAVAGERRRRLTAPPPPPPSPPPPLAGPASVIYQHGSLSLLSLSSTRWLCHIQVSQCGSRDLCSYSQLRCSTRFIRIDYAQSVSVECIMRRECAMYLK